MVCPRAQHIGDAQEIVAERFICRMKEAKRKESCKKEEAVHSIRSSKGSRKIRTEASVGCGNMETTGDMGRAIHVDAGAPCSKPTASPLAPFTSAKGRSRPERAASVKDQNPRAGSVRLGKHRKEGGREGDKAGVKTPAA